jgi:hypothetical protein
VKTFRTSRGPFSERPFFTDQQMESICLEELSKQGLLPKTPGPVRIERFVEKKFGVTVEADDLPPGVLGYTSFGSTGVTGVFVSKELEAEQTKSAQRRFRSTVAHEAGHGLLHAYLFALQTGTPLFGDLSDPNAPKVLCRGEAIEPKKGYDGAWWEFQANTAMGHLLMPRPLVTAAVVPHLVSVGTLGGTTIPAERIGDAARDLAEIFDVNPVVARIRLEALYAVANDKQLSL